MLQNILSGFMDEMEKMAKKQEKGEKKAGVKMPPLYVMDDVAMLIPRLLKRASTEEQLDMGTKVEAEHDTTVKSIIRDAKSGKLKPLKSYRRMIASNHVIDEKMPKYYTGLDIMEKVMKKTAASAIKGFIKPKIGRSVVAGTKSPNLLNKMAPEASNKVINATTPNKSVLNG